jgi:predicted HTH domain antitoxin
MAIIVSKTELARNTREILENVRKGQMVIVQSYGEEQVVLLDTLDYRILKTVAHYAVHHNRSEQEASTDDDELNAAISDYLKERISLAKAAEILGLSRFDLMARFERLGIPLRIGPDSLDETHDEIASARRGKDLA